MSNSKCRHNNVFDYSLTNDEVFLVGDAEIDEKGLIHHHIASANELYSIGIPQIITQVFKLEFIAKEIKRSTQEEENIDHIIVKINFSDVLINKPTMINYNSGKPEVLYPNMAILKDRTYKSNLKVNVHLEATAVLRSGSNITNTAVVKNFTLCRIPIMVGTNWCNTHKLSKEALMQLHEDPWDKGGYFIIDGNEWVTDCVENILYNKIRIFKNEGYGKEIMRAEFIAKPGDFYLNSDQFIIRWLNDGQITVEIRREKLKDIYIPFYLIFRLMGWNTDKQISDNILFGDNESVVGKKMDGHLSKAFTVKYAHLENGSNLHTQSEVLHYFADYLKDSGFAYLDVDNIPENYKKIYHFILEHVDIHFLQHMGSDKESRDKKLRFLSLCIRKMFLVKLGNMMPTDRDSYNSKRVHASGTNYAKLFKTYFNSSVIQQMKSKLLKDLKSISFFHINWKAAVRASVYGADFEKSITQAITAGNKSEITVSKRVRINRLATQLLSRKNQLNVLSTIRQVTAPSSDSAKQSERASEMRRLHLSSFGYICVASSPEGEKAGINKQLALFSFVTKATISAVIRDILSSDDDIILLDSVDYDDIRNDDLSNVYVNGDWIGCCANALDIVIKYRAKRRNLEISPEITIVWDNTQDEAYFWTDVGRVIRPLLIVYNNRRDKDTLIGCKCNPDSSEFCQGILLSKQHVTDLYAKRIGSQELLQEQIIEYISAEEQENMLVCPSYDILIENKNNETMPYTHCDIPQSMMGLSGHTSPFSNHNQTTRLQYQCNQCKQTCGRPSMNWPFRADKDSFLQYNCETPVVKTISNRYLFPNGSNCILAIMTNGGFNQEDSLIVNGGAVDRGLFNGCKLTFKKVELEQREEFANPDVTNTIDTHKDVCYDKLENGIIKIGSVVRKGDVLIGKIIKLPRNTDDAYQYADRSIIYKNSEPAIVHNVIVDRNEKDEEFCKVILRKVRPVSIGDKFSVRGSSQVLTDQGWIAIERIDVTQHQVATMDLDGGLCYTYPSALSCYNYSGDMYDLKTDDVEIFATRNHKMYVTDVDADAAFRLLRTHEIVDKHVRFCKNAVNMYDDIQECVVRGVSYPMDDWLEFVGMLLTYGSVGDGNVYIACERIEQLSKSLIKMSIEHLYVEKKIQICGGALRDEARSIILNARLPEYVWHLSQRQCRLLYGAMANKCTTGMLDEEHGLVDDLTRLALHCGWSASVFRNARRRRCIDTVVDELDNIPLVTPDDQKYVPYNGKVYCLAIPDTHRHVYYFRETATSPPMWTGNSNRSGQKGVAGLVMREEDMPFTENGMKPALIFNPLGIPKRMTIGMLNELLVGNWCAAKGTTTDSTIFRKVDIESIATDLEAMGFNRQGYERLYNGVTGEYIDTEIFMGNVYYQRLQKFTIDQQYAVSRGPSDAITNQPLDGMASGGGLRIGEMERDCLLSHGVSRFLAEKFFSHSDSYTEYVCRCGKAAVVNVKRCVYKCKYCGDNADIVAYPTSWSSKLFMQEMETMNVGIRRKPDRFTYDIERPEIFKEMDNIMNN